LKIIDTNNEPVEIDEGDICFVNIQAKTMKGKLVDAKKIVFSRQYGTETRSKLYSNRLEDCRVLKKFTNGKEKEVEIVEIVLLKKVGTIIRRK